MFAVQTVTGRDCCVSTGYMGKKRDMVIMRKITCVNRKSTV